MPHWFPDQLYYISGWSNKLLCLKSIISWQYQDFHSVDAVHHPRIVLEMGKIWVFASESAINQTALDIQDVISSPMHHCQSNHFANFSCPNFIYRKHIASAQHLDLFKCVHPTPTLPNNFPEKDCFQDYAQSLGINRDSHIVIYDRGTFFPAARAWWLFRVRAPI